MDFDHYKYMATPNPDRLTLEQIVASSRAREAREEAERKRDSRFRHKANMEQFRAWVHRQDHFTDEEKAEMIRASFSW